jgi:TonB family protein
VKLRSAVFVIDKKATGQNMQTLERAASAPGFSSLPQSANRWKYFSTSTVAQVLLLAAFIRLPFSLAAPVLQPVDKRESIHLVVPDPTADKHDEPIEVKKSPVPLPRPKIAPTLAVRLPEPRPLAVETPPKPVEVAKATPPTFPLPKAPRRVVSTDFGSSAPVTLQKPVHQVQTGGFGDPNGVPANSNSPTNKGQIIAKVGSFDLPGGPGTGNGTGGATGAKGTVASAGFGNGIAGPGQGGVGPAGQKKVQATNFGSADPPPVPDAPKRQVTTSTSKDTPVSLLSKPTPVYTTEARQKKIEGDVELDVEFTATGQVHVLRVVHGLGYGLDEEAVAAAQHIQFNPARHDGQPVDAHGLLRIVFRLS